MGMNDFKYKSCIRFRLRKRDTDYIIFYGDVGGCSSHLGKMGGRQRIDLGPSCIKRGNILHEIMHVLGFAHEQARPDRDEHVQVLWDNIPKKSRINFAKETGKVWDSFNSPYDVKSLMHYGSFYFSTSGSKPTLTDKNGNTIRVNRETFSVQDLMQINRKYECPELYINKALAMKTTTTTAATKATTTKAQITVCEDKKSSTYCNYYARRGDCGTARLEVHLRQKCPKTCKFCEVKVATSAKKLTTTTRKPTTTTTTKKPTTTTRKKPTTTTTTTTTTTRKPTTTTKKTTTTTTT